MPILVITDELLDYLAGKFENISQDPEQPTISYEEYVSQWVGKTELNLLYSKGVDIFAKD